MDKPFCGRAKGHIESHSLCP